MFYVTDGAWGSGLNVRLTAAQVDGNFYELRSDVDDLIANPPQANGIASISQSGNSITITLDNLEQMGPFYLPVLTFRYRGEWAPFAVYEALDCVAVAGSGLYLVVIGHAAGATFDPDAVGLAVTAGSFVISRTYVIETVGTTDFTAIGAVSNTVGVEFAATGAGAGTGTAKPKFYKLLLGSAALTVLDDLSDVTVTTPADGEALVYSGGIWVNQAIAQTLAGLTDVSLTGPASGEFLKFDGLDWVNATIVQTLSGLTDVTITTPADGEALVYSGGSWVNQAIAPATIPSTLDDLTDVVITPVSGGTPADGQLLTYDASAAAWINKDAAAVPTTLDALTDVAIGTVGDGDVLTYDSGSGQWVNAALAIAQDLDALTDVVVSSPASGEVLQFDGTQWGNKGGVSISGLPMATSPVDTFALLEIAEPTGSGSGPPYESRQISIGDLLASSGITSASSPTSLVTVGLTVGTTTLLSSSVSLSNGAGAATGTLTNAPVAGDPTKWIPINDNGTTRYIPCW